MIDLFFTWYFIGIPKQIKHVWVNYLWFFEKYFAVSELIKDYLAPWKGLYFEREKVGFDLGEMFYVWFSNCFSRFVGILIRTIALVVGFLMMLLVLIAGIAAFLVWALFLFALVYAAFKGFQVLFVK
jgi:hypothetical protein